MHVAKGFYIKKNGAILSTALSLKKKKKLLYSLVLHLGALTFICTKHNFSKFQTFLSAKY